MPARPQPVPYFPSARRGSPRPSGFPGRGDRVQAAAAAPPPHSIPYMAAERGAPPAAPPFPTTRARARPGFARDINGKRGWEGVEGERAPPLRSAPSAPPPFYLRL